MTNARLLGIGPLRAFVLAGALSLFCLAPAPLSASPQAVEAFEAAASSAQFKAGIAKLEAIAQRDANDVEAVFGVGVLRFLDAIASLQHSLYQHTGPSVENGRRVWGGIGGFLPALGLSPGGSLFLPANRDATPMTYARLREIMTQFADDLIDAERALARVGDRPAKLPIKPFAIAIDLDHDGRISPHERPLAALLGRGVAINRGEILTATLHFDTADASWLRGYSNVLLAGVNLILAFDFEKSYDAAAHNLYGSAATAFGRELEQQAKSGRPSDIVRAEREQVEAELKALGQPNADDTRRTRELYEQMRSIANTSEGREQRAALQAELRDINLRRNAFYEGQRKLRRRIDTLRSEERGQLPGGQYGSLLDLAAYIHTSSWRVTEPKRLAAVRTHLLEVIALNRKTWRLVRSETDDDREWLPSPRQTAPFGARALTDEIIDGWLNTMALAEQVLKGEKLLPHPRFRKGVNLMRFFETAREFDLVMMITGHGLLPYLDDGEVVDERAWEAVTRPLGRETAFYAAWFN